MFAWAVHQSAQFLTKKTTETLELTAQLADKKPYTGIGLSKCGYIIVIGLLPTF